MDRIVITTYLYQNENYLTLKTKHPLSPTLLGIYQNIGIKSITINQELIYIYPNSRNALSQLFTAFKGKAYLDYSSLKKKKESLLPHEVRALRSEFNKKMPVGDANEVLIERFVKFMEQQRLSSNTINTYQWMVRKFIECQLPKLPQDITLQDIYDFNTNYLIKGAYSISFQNQAINAIKKFYTVNFNRKLNIQDIERPKKEKTLPEILSQEEITKLIRGIENIKHKALISTIYACGLRIGELCTLAIKDLDKERKLIHIKKAKGGKDRVVPYPEPLQKLLREYYNKYRPSYYLFEGPDQKPYTNSSAAKILKRAAHKAGIKKKISLHTLRHSYATHLLENGTDLRMIQEILGHNSPKTTMIYTHVSSKEVGKVVSPFENIPL